MLRTQAFVPGGIKSRRTILLPQAASPSPPRVHGHIAKQRCTELTNTGQGNWTAQKVPSSPGKTMGHLQTHANWLPVVWDTHGKSHERVNRFFSQITTTLRNPVSLWTPLPAHPVFCQSKAESPTSQMVLILGQQEARPWISSNMLSTC